MTTPTSAVRQLGRQLRYDPVAACEAICAVARTERASVPHTAAALGISRRTLYRWLAEHELLGACWDATRRDLSPGSRAGENGNDLANVDVPQIVTPTATA